MARPTWGERARGFERAARVEAELARAEGPRAPAVAFAASLAIWDLFPGAFRKPRSAQELEDEARVRNVWARLRRPHVR